MLADRMASLEHVKGRLWMAAKEKQLFQWLCLHYLAGTEFDSQPQLDAYLHTGRSSGCRLLAQVDVLEQRGEGALERYLAGAIRLQDMVVENSLLDISDSTIHSPSRPFAEGKAVMVSNAYCWMRQCAAALNKWYLMCIDC